MIYFFHHYELPAILQQARIQQILVQTQHQQQQQQQQQQQNQPPRTDASAAPQSQTNNANPEFDSSPTAPANPNPQPTEAPNSAPISNSTENGESGTLPTELSSVSTESSDGLRFRNNVTSPEHASEHETGENDANTCATNVPSDCDQGQGSSL